MLARDVDFLATDTSVQSIKSETLGAVSVSHWNCVHLVGDFPIMSLNSSEYYIPGSTAEWRVPDRGCVACLQWARGEWQGDSEEIRAIGDVALPVPPPLRCRHVLPAASGPCRDSRLDPAFDY